MSGPSRDGRDRPGEWFTLAELAALRLPGLPAAERTLQRHADETWQVVGKFRIRGGRGGVPEYHVSLLPAEARSRLAAEAAAGEARAALEAASKARWSAFERLPAAAKASARARLAAVERVAALVEGGMPRQAAVALVARDPVGEDGGGRPVGARTLWRWLADAEAVPRGDRLAALAPRHAGRTTTAACDPRAWEYLKADYLRPEQPAFDACYRRLVEEAAPAHGWSPIPSAKTLQRRLAREIPRAVHILMRKGAEAAARTFPAQQRDRTVFRAMQALNGDSHTLDVFVRFPDGAVGRPVLTAFQDLAFGPIVGHRLARTETWASVRLALKDAIESFGIPEDCWLDNGRAFASKWISGGQPTRYRFKVKEDEPEGLLTALGIRAHWTTPYHSQAKPIERAFRDLCESIAKHPFCAGAYTGNAPHAKPENYGARAIPFAEFERFVAEQIVRHNTREGRQTPACRGRSFMAAFQADYGTALVQKATPGQLRLLLSAAEAKTVRRPEGAVWLGENRYWAPALVDHIGRKVVVRFDPDDLFLPVAVHALDGRLIAEAECIEKTGFSDITAAKEQARKRQAYLRAARELRDREIALSIDDLAALLPAPRAPEPAQARLIKLVANGRPPRAGEDDAGREGAASAASVGALLRDLDARGVVPFRRREGD